MEENSGKIKPFNRNDEQFLEAFVIFCGLGIQNTQMYEAVERAMAKQMVTLEVGRSPGGILVPTAQRPVPQSPQLTVPVTRQHPHERRVFRRVRPCVLF